MVNKDLLAAKLTELAARVARVRSHLPSSARELGADPDALDLVAFNLMLSVQSCADIAGHLIADEGWPAPRTLGESFSRLRERGVISTETSDRLRMAVGLRNIVAHGYAGLDVELCFTAAASGLDDLTTFAEEVSRWAHARG